MKRGLLIFTFLYSFLLVGYNQSIPSYWMNVYNLNDLYLLRIDNVEQIIADQTGYYSSGGTYKEKWIFNFVDSFKIKGQFFKDGQLSSSFEYKFDNSGKLISKKLTSKQPLIGWQSKIITYEYETGNLKYEKNFNNNMQLIDYVKFEYNTNNRPIKMSLMDASDRLISYETADYDEGKMIYYYKIFNSSGTLISDKIEYCNYDVSSNLINNYGDLVLLKWPLSNPEKNVLHQLEYKYDDQGNWIERKWLLLEGKKKEKRSITFRKIQYRRSN
jgi:hypothetical protein